MSLGKKNFSRFNSGFSRIATIYLLILLCAVSFVLIKIHEWHSNRKDLAESLLKPTKVFEQQQLDILKKINEPRDLNDLKDLNELKEQKQYPDPLKTDNPENTGKRETGREDDWQEMKSALSKSSEDHDRKSDFQDMLKSIKGD